MTNARVRQTRFQNVDIEIEAEKTADHLRRMREEFDELYKTRTPINAAMSQAAILKDAIEWYGNHPEVEQMIKDFNSY